MGTRAVRRGASQAGWNRRHAATFSKHLLLAAGLIAILFQSWWALLFALLVLQLLLSARCSRWLVLAIFSTPWAAVAYSVGFGLGGSDGAWVCAILGFGMAYVVLEAGSQYYDDLGRT